MCLSVPMKVTRVDGMTAVCAGRGSVRTASLFMMQPDGIVPGDYVLIQSDHVTARLSEEEALLTWVLFDEMARAKA